MISLEHTAFVIDASVVVKLFVEEPLQDRARDLFARLNGPSPVTLHAPDLLYVECASVLWKYVRRFGYEAALAENRLRYLAELQVLTTSTRQLVAHALPLALEFEISVYDASYVALARSLDCPLVTADERLVRKVSAGPAAVLWLGDLNPQQDVETGPAEVAKSAENTGAALDREA